MQPLSLDTQDLAHADGDLPPATGVGLEALGEEQPQTVGAMTDDELLGHLEAEERDAIDYMGSTIAEQRRQLMDYYFGRPFGNEEDGQSQVISTDVLDVVEGMLPGVLKPFVSTTDVCKFDPVGPNDEAAAEQETAYINHIMMQKLPGFEILRSWVWDGLAQKNGVVKYWWDTIHDVTTERYRGLSDDELVMIVQADEVDVVEHEAYPDPNPFWHQPPMDPNAPPPAPPMLHDITCRVRKERGQPNVAVVPPEEFLISRDATTSNPKKARFVEHRRPMTISELRKMLAPRGIDVPDDLEDGDAGDLRGQQEYQARHQDDHALVTTNRGEGPMREVLVRDMYPLVDYDGDGIAERRQVLMVGRTIFINEETEEAPFCGWTPIPIPHRYDGLCPADLAMDFQLVKSTIKRQIMQNAYTVNNNRAVVSSKVNLDDLMDNVIGGYIRSKSDNVAGDIVPLQATPIIQYLQPLLDYEDSEKENRTGFTRYNQGADADSLNKTATGVTKIMQAGKDREELISRTFAEMGLRDLMISLHGLCRRNATQPDTFRLLDQWVTVDPRDWVTRRNMTVSVGLGTGDKQTTVQNLMLLGQVQQQLAPMGLVGPEEAHATATKLAQAIGEKNASQFFKDPKASPPPPPQPAPEVQAQQLANKGLADAENIKARAALQRTMIQEGVKAIIEHAKLQQMSAEAMLEHLRTFGESVMSHNANAQLQTQKLTHDGNLKREIAARGPDGKASHVRIGDRVVPIRRDERGAPSIEGMGG